MAVGGFKFLLSKRICSCTNLVESLEWPGGYSCNRKNPVDNDLPAAGSAYVFSQATKYWVATGANTTSSGTWKTSIYKDALSQS
jgi:hypothetical protein